ncbi:AraC family transcriptional regulator [Cellulomonas chitinilytica]|uniref:AraC family transcriptional regulator n=1 Tax=Cellulomonas chitinilytica TaxID=398759 RepID=A0A919U3S2_9CELL|nr:helix-turn-helix domain-containing protein [Cellulomonas chitinilytica]GIG22717.1 AraC family transcriptional regulator [Cellulomonas chitinilytica]
MSFLYEERTSSSPYVDVVWQTRDVSDGTYLASADACWDMIFTVGPDGSRRALLCGPASRPVEVPYVAGNLNVGVRFAPGAFFTHVPARTLCDRTVLLPMPDAGHFELAGAGWPFPGYGDVDDLADAFGRHGLLRLDEVVGAALDGGAPHLSARTVERHFTHATGLSPGHVRQITRARAAVARLQQGRAIADVAHDLGYADQSHLTRDLKRLTGYTPGQSQGRSEPV